MLYGVMVERDGFPSLSGKMTKDYARAVRRSERIECPAYIINLYNEIVYVNNNVKEKLKL